MAIERLAISPQPGQVDTSLSNYGLHTHTYRTVCPVLFLHENTYRIVCPVLFLHENKIMVIECLAISHQPVQIDNCAWQSAYGGLLYLLTSKVDVVL